MRRKVVLVAHDKAPSVALELSGKKLQETLVKNENEVEIVMHCAHGAPPLGADDIIRIAQDASNATLLVTGVSSSAALAAEEVAAALVARKQGIRYGVYLDTDMGNRHWFDTVASDEVSFAFAPNAEEAALAAKRYRKARVFLTGNPLEEAASFPTTTREGIRATFGLRDDQPLILCPGGKDLAVNKIFLEGVVSAILHGMTHCDSLMVFSPHPGDTNDPKEYLDILEDAYYHACLVASPQHYGEKHPQHVVYHALWGDGRIHGTLFRGSDLIPGCDVVVQSASTIAKEAGYQRKPAVNYFTEAAYKRNPDLREWPPVARGVEEAVENPQALAETIARLLTPEGYAHMRARQEAVYLRPAYQGEAVEKIVTVLGEIVNA